MKNALLLMLIGFLSLISQEILSYEIIDDDDPIQIEVHQNRDETREFEM